MTAIRDISLSRQSRSCPVLEIGHVFFSQQVMDNQEEGVVMDILYLEGPELGVGILVMNHNTLVIANLRGIWDLYIVDGFWLLRVDF